MNYLKDEFAYLQQIWRETKPIFPRIMLADLLFKLLALLTISPLIGWLFNRLIQRSGSSAVSNLDIVSFMLSPTVLLGLVVVSILVIAFAYAESITLMFTAFAHRRGEPLTFRHIVQQVSAQFIDLLGLGLMILGRILLTLAPTLILALLAYLFVFSEHDVNYYIEVLPREVWIAAAIIGPVALYAIFLLTRYWLRWLFALPSIMFEQLPFREAMKRSEQLAGDKVWRLGRIVYLPLLAFIILGALLLTPVLFLSNLLLQSASSSALLLLLFTGFFVLFNWLLTAAIGVIGATIVPVLTASLYHDAQVEQAIPMRYEPAREDGLQFSWSRRRTIATVIIASLAVFAVGGLVLSNAYEQIAVVPTVTAHRGSSAVAPPNTLAAVQQAIDDGADYAEIDVQETADGVIILNHDKDYLLAAGNDADVHELTLAETQALDVGSSFSADFAGEPVPTLAEVLALAKGKIKVNIELKYYGQDVKLAERVVADVREAGMVDEVVIMSLHFVGVEETQRFAPEIATGFLVSDLTLGDETALDVDFLAVSSNLATPKFVRDTHASGKELYVWTINDAATVDTFLNRGVDSIITDYPVMVREQILERDALSSTEKLLLVLSDLLSQ